MVALLPATLGAPPSQLVSMAPPPAYGWCANENGEEKDVLACSAGYRMPGTHFGRHWRGWILLQSSHGL